jgi:medium-chain acyl-[acyl-carrier-protein] hydrolase
MPGDGRQRIQMVIKVGSNTSPKIYTEIFKIHTYEVDLHNRLTIQSLAQFLQEAASNHAALLGFGVEFLLKNNRTWVLSRMAIKIDNLISLGADTEKLFYIRDFQIENSKGGVIGNATSYWIFLDTEKRRPVHPAKGELVFNYDDIPRAYIGSLGKLPAPKIVSHLKEFNVRYSDLDLNIHVNNIRYIEWGLEGIDPAYKESHLPGTIEINFLNEAKYGDEVGLSIEEISAGTFLHSLFIDNTEICRIKSVWKNI